MRAYVEEIKTASGGSGLAGNGTGDLAATLALDVLRLESRSVGEGGSGGVTLDEGDTVAGSLSLNVEGAAVGETAVLLRVEVLFGRRSVSRDSIGGG